MPDQGQGILTATQREYLREEADVEPGSSHERAIRSRIRGRLNNAIYDLALMQATLEPRDIERAFTYENDRQEYVLGHLQGDFEEHGGPTQLFEHIVLAHALLFDGTALASQYADEEIGHTEEDTEELISMFARFVEEAVTAMFLQRGVTVNDVNAEIGVELGPNVSDVDPENLSYLTEPALVQLLDQGVIEPEEFGSEIKQRLES